MSRPSVRSTAAAALAAAALLGGCGPGPDASPADDPPGRPASEPQRAREPAPSSNAIPIGPPAVRARALGVPADRIAAIETDTRRGWDRMDRYDRFHACRQIDTNAGYMAEWMAGTGLPPGPEQELAAQTLRDLADSFCWRFRQQND
jgi:hypothetical protein